MKTIKHSLFSRAPKLLSSAIKMSLGHDFETVAHNLSELKGVPQKIGQMLSMDVTQYIPEELKEKLKPLQGESKALEIDIIQNILENELTTTFYNQIDDLDPLTLGAGSIGQVHRARVLNQQVVFKVQYPNIKKTIQTDLALLSPLATMYEFMRPDSKDFTILLKEAKQMLLSETDYKNEVGNLQFFKAQLIDDPRFIVPNVLEDYSSDTVICMEYIEGITLEKFFKKSPNTEEKKKIASALLDLFIKEFFIFGVVQTDPNFANFLICLDGKMALLDFGAVKKFDVNFRLDYLSLLKAAMDEDDDKIIYWGERFGLVDRNDKPLAVELFVSFMKDVMSYFREENNPVDFKREDITKKLMDTGWKLWKEQRMSKPDSQLVFLHRKLGGLFSVLKESHIEIDLHEYWLHIVKSV